MLGTTGALFDTAPHSSTGALSDTAPNVVSLGVHLDAPWRDSSVSHLRSGNILENNSRQISGIYEAHRLLKGTLHFSKLNIVSLEKHFLKVCQRILAVGSQLCSFIWDEHGVRVGYQGSPRNVDC